MHTLIDYKIIINSNKWCLFKHLFGRAFDWLTINIQKWTSLGKKDAFFLQPQTWPPEGCNSDLQHGNSRHGIWEFPVKITWAAVKVNPTISTMFVCVCVFKSRHEKGFHLHLVLIMISSTGNIVKHSTQSNRLTCMIIHMHKQDLFADRKAKGPKREGKFVIFVLNTWIMKYQSGSKT